MFLNSDKAKEHYTSLMPDKGFTLRDLSEDVLDGPHVGLRGAARSCSSAGARPSVQLRVQAAGSLHTRKPIQQMASSPASARSSVRKELEKQFTHKSQVLSREQRPYPPMGLGPVFAKPCKVMAPKSRQACRRHRLIRLYGHAVCAVCKRQTAFHA